MARRAVLAGVIVAAVLAASTSGLPTAVAPATASDYSNECKSADKRYDGEPGALYLASDQQRTKALTYVILDEQVLAEKRSACIPKAAEAGGRRYENLYRKTRQTVVVDDPTGPRTVTLVCELAASGLPAAFNCDREVVSKDVKTAGPVKSFRPGTPGTWTHNGSVMRLEAEGNTRRFVYANPREGLRKVGVSAESILFDGAREGNRYTGTARYFSKACGEQTFPVEGIVSADEQRVELKGTARLVDDKCQPAAPREETLVFIRQK